MDVPKGAGEVRVAEEEWGICGGDHMVLQTKSSVWQMASWLVYCVGQEPFLEDWSRARILNLEILEWWLKAVHLVNWQTAVYPFLLSKIVCPSSMRWAEEDGPAAALSKIDGPVESRSKLAGLAVSWSKTVGLVVLVDCWAKDGSFEAN